ncbi:MAG: hypothetical protein ACK5LE_04790 [Alphaproteobacteria bacterium]
MPKALTAVMQQGNLEFADILLNAENNDGYTAAEFATQFNQAELAKYLQSLLK